MVPCLGTSICLLLPWSNTFGFWFRVVYKHQSPPVSQKTRFDYGSWSAYASVSSLVQTRLNDCLFVVPPARTKMKVTPEQDRILHRARAPIQLSTFIKREELFGVDDVALVCTKEQLLDETLIAPAKAAGVPCNSLTEKVCIKKVLTLCREAFATGRTR